MDPDTKILVIDDEKSIRRTIKAYFEDNEATVIEAEDGQKGVDIFRKENPDLVLLDLRMPVLDGIAALKIIVSESPQTPVIVVSGTGVLEDSIEALRNGAWDYITKPIHDMAELEHLIEKALERKKLIEEQRKHHEILEATVVERTLELKNKIAEQKKVEIILKESESFLDNVFSCMQDGLCVIDSDMNILRVNPVMEKMYPHEVPMKGKKCYKVYHGYSAPCKPCPSLESLRTGKMAQEAIPYRDEAGNITGWLELRTYPLLDNEKT